MKVESRTLGNSYRSAIVTDKIIGKLDCEDCADYILNCFVLLNEDKTRQIYAHFTCATDTTQICGVMDAVNGESFSSTPDRRFLQTANLAIQMSSPNRTFDHVF